MSLDRSTTDVRKVYKTAGSETLVRFYPKEVQAVYPVQEDSCCPKGFSVVLDNGRGYRLAPEYYPEVRGFLEEKET